MKSNKGSLKIKLLLENLYGHTAMAYSGVTLEKLKSLLSHGFDKSLTKQTLLGKGMYATLYFDKAHATFKGQYGDNIIKIGLNLNNFLIFTPEIAKQIYSKPDLMSQIKYLNLYEYFKETYEKMIQKRPTDYLTFDEWFIKSFQNSKHENLSGQMIYSMFPEIENKIDGLCLKKPGDGQTLVIYDVSKIKLLSWQPLEKLLNPDKTINQDAVKQKWPQSSEKELQFKPHKLKTVQQDS